MGLADKLRKKGIKDPSSRKRAGPLWRGPEQDGVTFSLLSRFLVDRERFRIYVLEGLRSQAQFDHKSAYGDMWHVCEEAHAAGTDWKMALVAMAQEFCRRHPMAQEQVDHWYNVCKVTFPRYVAYWRRHPNVLARTPLLQERVFNVPYPLPSGRVVKLRGKWDSVDIVRSKRGSAVWLQENKTRGDIREGKIVQQLSMDLQTMLYLTALQTARSNYNKMGDGQDWIEPIAHNFVMHPLAGVRYNVARRPLSGGKGSITRHKPSRGNPAGESKEHFYGRLAAYIDEAPETYFMRWDVLVPPTDVERFKSRCLTPLLEHLCVWWQAISSYERSSDVFEAPLNTIHWQHPYGVWNVLNEGGQTELDNYLATGSELGLERVTTLFGELG
jgi:hypothetical protein